MSKNILVFSDGTGQAGGLRPDQRLSNIYKLYRATRVGPENPSIDPMAQVAFYDPGLGTVTDAGGVHLSALQKLMAIFGQATGMGITDNIIDCYAAILKFYEPGDRICIFGFSRGAYTARCVANVIRLCGIPTVDGNGERLPTDGPCLRKIAKEAVLNVYEHRFLKINRDRVSSQEAAAITFRNQFKCNSEDCLAGNVAPAFIGVFDTVAALGVRGWKRFVFIALLAAAVAIFSLPTALVIRAISYPLFSYWTTFFTTFLLSSSTLGIKLFLSRWKLKEYDQSLDPRAGYARHARAIDETRADFLVLGWGHSSDVAREVRPNASWFKQMWFAGNHSDIGGSYPEDESRLSDIALEWMLSELRVCVPEVLIEEEKIKTWGSADGMQHCEVQYSRERQKKWKIIPAWEEATRKIDNDAPLHPSVLRRFELPEVRHCRKWAPYRPESLRNHHSVAKYFEQGALTR